MTARRPALAPIAGHYVQLEQLTDAALPELFAAIGHPLVFAGGYGGGPSGYRDTLEGFIEFANGYYNTTDNNVYVVRLIGGPNDGTLVGTTTLGDFDLELEHTHVGWTAYDPRVWRSAVNVETKLLVLGLAFENGFGRVKIQADALNLHSRGAILKLGATFEGIMRRDRPRADGSWRDTAIYSVLADEWPTVRAGLEQRLAAFGGVPVVIPPVTDGGLH
jgi:RimJ/RimL family protein N-acetyltransferase